MDFAILVIAFNLQKLHNKTVKQRKRSGQTENTAEKIFVYVFLAVRLRNKENLFIEEERKVA